MHHKLSTLVLCALSLGACTGQIGETPRDPDDFLMFRPAEVPDLSACEDKPPSTGLSGVRRLTREQYGHAVEDIFHVSTDKVDRFSIDGEDAGFGANVTTVVDGVQLQAYLDAAEDVAGQYLSTRASTDLTCDRSDESGCIAPFLQQKMTLAFRRPVADQELEEVLGVFRNAAAMWDQDKALELAIQTILMSPQFLYMVELEPSGPDDIVLLPGVELATRLSFFFWNSPPDQALLDAANNGELDTVAGIRTQASRLMTNTTKFNRTLASFHDQWLHLNGTAATDKDPEIFPDFSSGAAAAMSESFHRYVEDVYATNPTLDTLFTSNNVFANDQLNDVFKTSVAGPELQKTGSVSSIGILTQPRVMASHAKPRIVSWVERGVMIRRLVLCQSLPEVPDMDVIGGDQNPDRLQNPDCSTCHRLIDPLGQAFDGFDAIGTARTVSDDGGAILDSGNFDDIDGKNVTFASLDEMISLIAKSDELKTCMTRQWLRYALVRSEEDSDACSLATAREALRQSDGDLSELLLSIVSSDSFRYRKKSEAQ